MTISDERVRELIDWAKEFGEPDDVLALTELLQYRDLADRLAKQDEDCPQNWAIRTARELRAGVFSNTTTSDCSGCNYQIGDAEHQPDCLTSELLQWRQLGRECNVLATEPAIDEEGLRMILEKARQLLKPGVE